MSWIILAKGIMTPMCTALQLAAILIGGTRAPDVAAFPAMLQCSNHVAMLKHSGPVCRIFAAIQTNAIRIARAGEFGENDQGIGLPHCKIRQSGSPALREGTRTRLSLIAARTKGPSRSGNPDRGIFEGGFKIRQAGSSDLRCPTKIRQSRSPYL